MDIPVLRLHSRTDKTNIDNVVLQCLEHSPWQICVPYQDSLFWSVVLSYLMQNTKDEDEIIRRIKQFDCEKINIENLSTCVKKYNPFLNRFQCYFDDDFKQLIKFFKKKARSFVMKPKNKKYFFSFDKTRDKNGSFTRIWFGSLLQASAYVLKCEIALVLTRDNPSEKNVQNEVIFYTKNDETETWSDRIIIYGNAKPNSNFPHFHFGLAIHNAERLQKTAFYYILRSGGLKNQADMETIYFLSDSKTNLFAALLKKGYTKITEQLLRCPLNVAFKLHEAGFGIDPTRGETSQTAFYHAVCKSETKILFLLHAFFINTAIWNTNAARQPDEKVIIRLAELTGLLEKIEKQYENLQANTPERLDSIKELASFHAFQVAVCGKVTQLRPSGNDKVLETCRRKEMIFQILDTYNYHFHIERDKDNMLELYDGYMKFQNYFQVLDFQSALFFFDNIFALKDRLKLSGKSYDSIETPFARFLFWKCCCLKYYPSWINASSSNATQLPEKMFLTLVFLERISFKQCIDSFLEVLSKAEITDKNMLSELSYEDIHTLETEPVLKDEFVLRRLKHYIELALTADLKNVTVSELGILAIQRCLHVIGETLSFEKSEIPTVLKSLLIYCLQDATKSDFRKIRHNLSHTCLQTIASRIEVEKDIIFFLEIQEEIKVIDMMFEHIYELQSLRIRKYAYENGLRLMEEWKKIVESLKPNIQKQMSEEEDKLFSETFLRMPVEDFYKYSGDLDENTANSEIEQLKRCNRLLEQLQQYSEMLIELLRKTEEELKYKLRNSVNTHKRHFDAQLSRLKNKCKSLNKSKPTYEDDKTRIEQCFMSLKLSLEFIVTESGLGEIMSEELEQMEALVKDMKEGEFVESLEEFEGFCSRVVEKLRHCTLNADASSPEVEECVQVHKLKQILQGFCYLSEESKNNILTSVPQEYIDHNIIKCELLRSLQKNTIFTDGELISKIKRLQIKTKKKKQVKEMYDKRDYKGISEVKDYYEILKTSLEEEQIDGSDYTIICDKFFKQSKVQKEELKRIVKGYSPTVKDRTVEFFYSRVEKLKRLLINRYPDVRKLWETAKRDKTRKFAHDKLVCYFLQDSLLQAAVEQLLFDCMVVLKERKSGLQHIWVKANQLFNGISVRNVFAHGNPLFECVGNILDPSDLPNEIVEKVLELVCDLEAIKAMHELVKKNPEMGFEEFTIEVHADTHDEDHLLWQQIKECQNWEGYSYLLPETREKNRIFSSSDGLEEQEASDGPDNEQ